VFPGGRVDKADNRIPVAAPISAELEANLLKGSPKIATSRARALAVAAIREACEETGLCLGRKVDKPAKLEGAWKPFTEAGLLPDPSSLFLIARAITPPGRVRPPRPHKPANLEAAWKPFTEAGLLPDPSSLFLIARAITPPGRVRRFDTR